MSSYIIVEPFVKTIETLWGDSKGSLNQVADVGPARLHAHGAVSENPKSFPAKFLLCED